MEQGKLSLAVPWFQEAATDLRYRESYKAWTNLGLLWGQQKKFKKAEEAFQKAIQEAPRQAIQAYYHLGKYFLEKGETEKARFVWKELQSYSPESSEGKKALSLLKELP